MKRGLPAGSQRLVHFVERHQVNLSTLKQLFWSREIQLTVYQRPGEAQRNKQEWWITPEQHQALVAYVQQQHISFVACSLCNQEDSSEPLQPNRSA